MRKNRIASIACGLTMLVGMLPMSAMAAENPFEDVTENDYCYNEVLWAYNHDPQITNGMDETHFAPDEAVTRGQAMTFLWRANGCPEPTAAASEFEDVSEDDYFFKPVTWAVENGITNGTDETHFSPNETCSTAHIVTFLYRALDVGEDGWFEEAAQWADSQKLLDGADLDISPDVECSRAPVAVALCRALNESCNADEPDAGEGAETEESSMGCCEGDADGDGNCACGCSTSC